MMRNPGILLLGILTAFNAGCRSAKVMDHRSLGGQLSALTVCNDSSRSIFASVISPSANQLLLFHADSGALELIRSVDTGVPVSQILCGRFAQSAPFAFVVDDGATDSIHIGDGSPGAAIFSGEAVSALAAYPEGDRDALVLVKKGRSRVTPSEVILLVPAAEGKVWAPHLLATVADYPFHPLLAVADIDGDGVRDIVLGGALDRRVEILFLASDHQLRRRVKTALTADQLDLLSATPPRLAVTLWGPPGSRQVLVKRVRISSSGEFAVEDSQIIQDYYCRPDVFSFAGAPIIVSCDPVAARIVVLEEQHSGRAFRSPVPCEMGQIWGLTDTDYLVRSALDQLTLISLPAPWIR